MIKYFSYSDEIVLFWDKKSNNILSYKICLNGVKIGESTKTFFRIKNLLSKQSYNISISAIYKNGSSIAIYNKKCWTTKTKKDLVVTFEPYNAIGDGKTLNTKSIQKAIDDCDKNHRVVIPSGVFLTGSLRLNSDVEVYIEKDGVLKGSEIKDDYLPIVKSRFEGWECDCYSSLINVGFLDHLNGANTKNIMIHGEGKIIGGGEKLLYDILQINGHDIEEQRLNLLKYQEHLTNDEESKYRKRGRLISVNNAENVIIDGLELGNSPSWNIHMVYSKNIITCGCSINSIGIWNGDGWNPDSSTNCTLFDTKFNTGDDCVAIKSGKNPQGNIINIPSKNIKIFSCFIKKGKSHGISIGSEISGGIKNVNIWDSDFSNSFFGLHIKTTNKRGGYIKNINVNNCKLSRVLIRKVDYNDDGESSNELTEINNLNLKNIIFEYGGSDPNFTKEADSFIYINGFDVDNRKVNNIKFYNTKIINKENIKEYNVSNCSNVTFNGKKIS